MYWNHRLVRRDDWVALMEVYYGEASDKPNGYCHADILWTEHDSESLADSVSMQLRWFKEACEKPVLTYPDDFDK